MVTVWQGPGRGEHFEEATVAADRHDGVKFSADGGELAGGLIDLHADLRILVHAGVDQACAQEVLRAVDGKPRDLDDTDEW